MSDLLREMEKHDNPIKWRKTNGGWVGNKRSHFPSWIAFIEKQEKAGKAEKTKKAKKPESAIKSCILILDQPRIRNKSFLGYRWHVLTLRCKWMPTNYASG